MIHFEIENQFETQSRDWKQKNDRKTEHFDNKRKVNHPLILKLNGHFA